MTTPLRFVPVIPGFVMSTPNNLCLSCSFSMQETGTSKMWVGAYSGDPGSPASQVPSSGNDDWGEVGFLPERGSGCC